MTDVDYIELPAETETPRRPAFQRGSVKSSTFTTVAWCLSNFGLLAPHVWWGYKVGYYVLIFPCLFGVSFSIDFVIIFCRLMAYLMRRLFDVVLSSATTAIKMLITAAAVILVVMYIYNNGLDGMSEDYRKCVSWLKCFVSP